MEKIQMRHCVIGAALVYLILIVLFVTFEEKVRFSKDCFDASTCVRFCCHNEANCDDKLIRTYYDGRGRGLKTGNYKIILGPPKCKEKLITPYDAWKFTNDGEVIVNSSQPTDRYCLKESSDSAPFSWELHVCDSKLVLRKIIHLICHLLSILLLSVAIIVYLTFKKLRRSNHGASVKYFLFGLFLMYASLLSFQDQKEYALLGAYFGMALSFMWMSVLSFDLWWTIKDGPQIVDANARFKYYCLYAFGMLGVCIFIVVGLFGSDLLALQPFLVDHILLTFAFFVGLLIFGASVKFVLLVLTAYKLIQMARTSNIFDRRWYDDQKKRFFMYLQVYAIMLTTGIFEFYSQDYYRSTESLITLDVFKFVTAFLFFAIFVLNQDVRTMMERAYRNVPL